MKLNKTGKRLMSNESSKSMNLTDIINESNISKRLNTTESVNEGQLNEIGVLGVAGGVALGLVGVIALNKGLNFAKRKFGDAVAVASDKLEKKLKQIESDKVKNEIIAISKKFENDKKLQGMYQALPPYKEGKSNKERKKGMAEIAKYVKSKLSEEEMKYFYDLNTFLRTGKIKGTLVPHEKKTAFQKRLDKTRHDNEHWNTTESVNEGPFQGITDPQVITAVALTLAGLTGVYNADRIEKILKKGGKGAVDLLNKIKKSK